jgi:hypothetical protein
MLLGGRPATISLPLNNCVIPEGVEGAVAIWITNDTQPLSNNIRDRAVAPIIAGPMVAFVDPRPDMMGVLVQNGTVNPDDPQFQVPGNGSVGAVNGSTTTLSSAASTTPPDPNALSTPPGAAPASTAPASTTPLVAGSVPEGSSPSQPEAAVSPGDPLTPGQVPSANLVVGRSQDGDIIVNGWTTGNPPRR